MADTDIKLSVDLDITDADKTAQQLEREIKRIFQGRGMDQSASFTQLELQMKQNLQKAQALRQELERLSKEKIPTEEYKEVSRRLDKMNSQFDKLLIKQDEMQELGQTAGPAWEKLNIQMEQLGTLIREDAAELQQLVDTGKAFTLGSESAAYQKTMAALDGVNDKLKQEVIRHRELEDAEEQKARKTEESNSRVESSNNRVTQSYRRAGRAAAHEAQQIGHAFTRRILPAVRAVRSAVSRMNHSLTRGLKPATANVKRLAMRFLMLSLGARSMFALLRKVRTAIIQSFGELQESGISPITEQIKELKVTLSQVKNSFVAAFEPIIAMVLPYLQRMAEALGNVIDKLAQFIAVLAGKNKYIRAIKQVGDAVEESGDKASGSLASFDKLNTITFDNEDAKDKSNKYEEVAIEENLATAASKVKERLDELYNNFKDFKDKLKKIIDKIKIGDWLGASADLGSLVDTLLTKLTEKIKNFIPSTGQAEELGKAIAEFLRNAHLSEHLVEAAGVLGDAIVSIFTIAFSTLRSFSDDELKQFGENIMNAIIKIFDAIIDVLKNLPTREIAMVLRGALSKAWDVADKLAEVLKLLFVKAFSVLWTTLTGDELTEGAEKVIGEAAVFASLAIGIGNVVRAIMGGRGVTGLVTAFSEKDRAFNRQKGPLDSENSGMSTLFGNIRNVVGAIGRNLLPLFIGTTGLISLFSGASEKTDTLTDSIEEEGKEANKSAKKTNNLKEKVQELVNYGSNSYNLSGIQAISEVIASIGTSASNSRSEIKLLQDALDEYNTHVSSSGSSAGNTQVVKGTSGVTYDTKTGKVNSPAITGSKTTAKGDVQVSWSDIEAYAKQQGLELNQSNINWITELLQEHPEKAPSYKKPAEKPTLDPTGTIAPVSDTGIRITESDIEWFQKEHVVGVPNAYGKDEFTKYKGLTIDEIWDLVNHYGSVEKAKGVYRELLSLASGAGTNQMRSNADTLDEQYLSELKSVGKTLGIDLDPYAEVSNETFHEVDRLLGIGGTFAALVSRLWALIDMLQGRGYFGGGTGNVIRPKFGIKAMASGGVIPAGKPFLAMLGDQKSGTNVEAPLDTIKQALSEVLADANMNATFQIVGDPHGMFKVIQKEATNYTKATGRLAF